MQSTLLHLRIDRKDCKVANTLIQMRTRLLFLSSLLCLVVSFFSSCERENFDSHEIRLSSDEVFVGYNGGKRTITVKGDGKIISVTSKEDWIEATHTVNSITLRILPNDQEDQRSGVVTVNSGYGLRSLKIIQMSRYASEPDDDDPGNNDNDPGSGSNPGGGADNPPVNKLAAPTNVKAVQKDNTIVVTWNSVEGATRYEVVHAIGAHQTYLSAGYFTGLQYTDDAITSESNFYKVRAIGATLNDYSDFSEPAYCLFKDKGSSETPTKPSIPTGLRAVQKGETIEVSWNPVPDVYYYRLWYTTPIGGKDYTNVYAPETTAIFDRNMQNGRYTFWIQATNSNYDFSPESDTVTCNFSTSSGGGGGGGNSGNDTPKKLETPTNLEAWSGDSFVQISFDEVPLGYQYELYRSSSAASGYVKIPASGGSTANHRYVLTDQNPKSGTQYYKVKAIALSSLGIVPSNLSEYVKVTRQ